MLDLAPAKKLVLALLKASELEYKNFHIQIHISRKVEVLKWNPSILLNHLLRKKSCVSKYMGFSFSMGKIHHWG
jgi:hypothetical protein